MPSGKPRIAAYISDELDRQVKAFQSQRGLKSESQALTVILSEFFEVSQEVTHSRSSVITELSDRIETLRVELLSELGSRLRESEASFESRFQELEQRFNGSEQDEAKAESSSPSELTNELLAEEASGELLDEEVPGQLKLIPTEDVSDSSSGELLDESNNESLTVEEVSINGSLLGGSSGKPLDGSAVWSGAELSKRLEIVPSAISSHQKRGFKHFADWTRSIDPDKIAWKRAGKRYLPIVKDPVEEEEF